MKKELYTVLVATAMLVLIETESGWAKVRRIIDEDDITAFTGQLTIYKGPAGSGGKVPAALEGVMCGSSAIIVSEYGKGRVACISPHPEKTPGLEHYIYRAVRWAAGERTGTSPFSKPE